MNCSVSNIFNVILILTLLSTTAIASDFSINKRPFENIESALPVKKLHIENIYFYKLLNELVELANNNDEQAQSTIIHDLNIGIYSKLQIQNSNIQLDKWHSFHNVMRDDPTYWKMIIYMDKVTPFFSAMIQELAQQDNPMAQYYLGHLYLDGIGTVKDPKKAFECIKNAADQGYPEAHYQLGKCYLRDTGTAKNPEKALEYFQKAAAHGHIKSQFTLGMFYTYGNGTQKNHQKAFEYFQKAADQGYPEAQYQLGQLYFNGIGTVKDHKKAFEYVQKAAAKGHIESYFILGIYYTYGNGTQKDHKKAFEYFQKAADQGIVKAEWAIGHLYEIGDGTKKNLSKAIEMYMKASKQNQSDAIEDVNRFFKIANNQLPIPQGIEDSIKDYREDIHTFKLSHAAAAQTWQSLAERNNPNSGFKNDGLQIPYLHTLYKDLAEIYFNIDLIVEKFLDPSFMINCVKFIHNDFNILYNLGPQDYIKRCDIKPKVNINAPSYTTFGIQNIKIVNMLIKIVNDLNSNESLHEIENLHINTLKKLFEKAYFIQIHLMDAINETEANSKKIKHLNDNIEKENEYIRYLIELKQIPNQLRGLAIKGTMIRNYLFAEEYKHIERI